MSELETKSSVRQPFDDVDTRIDIKDANEKGDLESHCPANALNQRVIGDSLTESDDALRIGDDQEKKQNRKDGSNIQRDKALEKIFLITNLAVELPSAVFDQLSSVHKPQYALISMIMSFTVMLISIIDLARMGRRERVKWMRRGKIIPWFYSPYPIYKPLGTFADIVGLVCGIFQCASAAIAYAFLSQKADSPIKISVWPLIFAFGVLCSRFPRNPRPKSALRRLKTAHPSRRGLQPPDYPSPSYETPLLFQDKNYYRDLSEIAEQAKRRAEVARLRELNTLKGHVESVVRTKGLDIDPEGYYSV